MLKAGIVLQQITEKGLGNQTTKEVAHLHRHHRWLMIGIRNEKEETFATEITGEETEIEWTTTEGLTEKDRETAIRHKNHVVASVVMDDEMMLVAEIEDHQVTECTEVG